MRFRQFLVKFSGPATKEDKLASLLTPRDSSNALTEPER